MWPGPIATPVASEGLTRGAGTDAVNPSWLPQQESAPVAPRAQESWSPTATPRSGPPPQTPAVQVVLPGQATPHPPQFAGSDERSTQVPSQLALPPAQYATQAPA